MASLEASRSHATEAARKADAFSWLRLTCADTSAVSAGTIAATMHRLPTNLDLNLLRVLVQVHRDRHVSQAAEHLGMSQPAVSSALKRLREALGDKLFIPTARGMQATPLADQIAPQIASALAAIGDTITSRVSFEAETSERRFVVAMTDIGEIHFLPPLVRALHKLAPGVSIATVRNTAVNLRVEMEQGQVDLALGHLPDLTTDFHQRLLFRQRYVCLFRKGHPLERASDPRAAYAAAEHALVLSIGTGHGLVDEFIDKADIHRRIRLRVPHFVALTDVLESSDLVATVPEVFAQRSVRRFQLAYRSHPLDPPPIEIRAFWHAKYHQDPANRWLRDLILQLFGEGEGQGAGQAGSADPWAQDKANSGCSRS